MENIFTKTGYIISNKTKANHIKVSSLQINNPDGSPRWIWNASNKKPIFLKFYNIGSVRAAIFANLIKLVFLLRLQKFVFKNEAFYIEKTEDILFDFTKTWALFTGTKGPNNKAILFDTENFIKIANTINAEKLLTNEFHILQKLNKINVTFLFPDIENFSNNCLFLTDISKNGIRFKKTNEIQLDALTSLYKTDNKIVKIKNWDYFLTLKKKFEKINNTRIPANIIRKINMLLSEVSDDDEVELSFSHGDYTQWNMYKIGNQLGIYDWELASFERPKGFDYFHLIFQNNILVERKNWKDIEKELISNIKGDFFKEIFKEDEAELKKYLKWYLLVNCMNYLDIYAAQKDWHVQINWLLTVWNEGLNSFLNQHKTDRELLVMDLFDVLHNHEYAALKIQNGLPETISLNSDIDLVIHKDDNDFIINFIKNHALVKNVTLLQKSFMNAIQITTTDSQILAVDLIWQLKRKNIEILDAEDVIKTSYCNQFGVKNASNIYTARYVVLFYILNNAEIPKKYLVYEEAIANSNADLDSVIKEYFFKPTTKKDKLNSFLKTNPRNTGFKPFKNTFNYGLDTLKSLIKSSGYIITFSGVDGAGKTTIIENMTQIMEKQFRKPVVLLRHRPSILPILSVWSKGKQKAHLDTISSLPRQGNNKSFSSSFIRFLYYYSDYLFGQFIIYFKYILRGKVVIYDRYYFDFINDSKRSNIELPKKLTRFGYHFLCQPKYNFFLFADAATILKRKQELEAATIEQLTTDYKDLFDNLQGNNKKVVYEAINNEDLQTSLNHIVKTIITR